MNLVHLMRPGEARTFCGRKNPPVATTGKAAFLRLDPAARCSQCGVVADMNARPRGKAVKP
jgi:hypothetical protein